MMQTSNGNIITHNDANEQRHHKLPGICVSLLLRTWRPGWAFQGIHSNAMEGKVSVLSLRTLKNNAPSYP